MSAQNDGETIIAAVLRVVKENKDGIKRKELYRSLNFERSLAEMAVWMLKKAGKIEESVDGNLTVTGY